MRDVAAAGGTAQLKATSAASAVCNVPLILLPKSPDEPINASSVPRRRLCKALIWKDLFNRALRSLAGLGQHPLPVSGNSCR